MIEPAEDFDPIYGPVVRRQDPREFDVNRERLATIRRLAGSRGRALLEDVLLAIPASETRARLELPLADWLQWQGSTRSAREHYEAIWQDAGEAGLEPLRRRWFGAPVALPASGAFELPDREAGPAMPVTLRVNEYGRVRVEEIDVAQARRRDARRLRMHLRRDACWRLRQWHRSTAGSCSRTGCCSRTEPRAPARCAPPRQRLLMISSAPDAAREPVVRQFLTSPPCFAMQRSAIS